MSTEQLITFLKIQRLNLNDNTLNTLRYHEIDGDVFCTYSETDLVELGISKGPARKLFTFIQGLRNKSFIGHGKMSYFFHVPPSSWSFEHFCNWADSCWPSRTILNKNDDKHFFYHTLGKMKDDSTTSPEVLNTILVLLKSKKKVNRFFLIFYFL